jgi:outer membrane protein assembly factor BamA
LAAGRKSLEGLDIVRAARTEVAKDSSADSLVTVLVQVSEAPLRVVSGEVGYATSGGITGQAT